jgi:hypothetical protein
MIQQPRLRRACIGELVQIDGCEHHWFEDRAPPCTALVFIDDATSRPMQILFKGRVNQVTKRHSLEEALYRISPRLRLSQKALRSRGSNTISDADAQGLLPCPFAQ